MEVFWKKGQLEDTLTWAFERRYRNKGVALTGLLLARPEDSLTREEVLPHLDFWNHRSADYVDFFCVGYIPRWYADSTAGLPPVVTVRDSEWTFALSAFVELVEEIETTVGVAYDGSPCLLLLNSFYDGTRMRARLDYSRIVWINFRKAIQDGAVSTPTQLAEWVFQFAKQSNGHPIAKPSRDPVWELGAALLERHESPAFSMR